jgi:hypothetical protein
MTPEQRDDLLAHATEFTWSPVVPEFEGVFMDWPNHDWDVVLAARGGLTSDGEPMPLTSRWAICRSSGSRCWSRSRSAWVWEHMPSERSKKHIADTRFGFEEAVALVPELVQRMTDEVRRRHSAQAEAIRASRENEHG